MAMIIFLSLGSGNQQFPCSRMHRENFSGASGSSEAVALGLLLGLTPPFWALATDGSSALLRAHAAGASASSRTSAATVRVRIVVSLSGGRAAASRGSRAI